MAKLHPAGIPAIDWARADHLIELALSEDLDLAGDTTTLAVIPQQTRCRAVLRCKENEMILAGLPVAEKVFGVVDPAVVFTALKKDGDFCKKGDLLAEMTGPAQSILTAERTALNFLQRLSGVATTARRYADALEGTKCVILDTRKTTPGYRNLEKYAVAVGGAVNHRIGLFDMIMIKDNHRELALLGDTDGIIHAVAKARAAYEAAKSEYLRDSVLVQDNIVTALHYEESRLAYTNARLELEALTGGVIDGPIEVRSDFSGRIESVRVSNGEYVDAGQPVAVVRAGHLLELQVDVPVRYATMAADCKDARLLTVRGDAVTVRGLGGYVVGCSQNAVDGYLTLTFIVPQTDGLIAGVPTDVWLLPDTGKTGLSIPAQAVIEEQGVTSVFVRLDEDCFEKREVVLGNCDGSRYEVLKGLSEGENIVVEGAMHIKLATIQAIPHGHSHNH